MTANQRICANERDAIQAHLNVLTVVPSGLGILNGYVVQRPFIPHLDSLVVHLRHAKMFVSFVVINRSKGSPQAFNGSVSHRFRIRSIASDGVVSTFYRARATAKIIRVDQRSRAKEVTTKRQRRGRQGDRQRECVFRRRVNESHRCVLFEARLNPYRLRVRIEVIVIIADHVTPVLRGGFVVNPLLNFTSNRMSFPLLDCSFNSSHFFDFRIVPSDFHVVDNVSLFGCEFAFFRSREIFSAMNIRHATVRVR